MSTGSDDPWDEAPPEIAPVRRTITVEDIARGRTGYEAAEPQPKRTGRAERALLTLAAAALAVGAWFAFFIVLGLILRVAYETAQIGWALL